MPFDPPSHHRSARRDVATATQPVAAGLRVDQLRGFRIGVTSDRRADDLIAAFERRGATVLHAPAVRIAAHASDESLVTDTARVIAAAPEVVLVTTGYGMRRWFEVADAAGLGHQLSAVLDRAEIYARGPKAQGAVRAAGFEANPGFGDPNADTTAVMIDRAIAAGVSGRRVVVQQHGFTDAEQLDRLAASCRELLTVTPYRWTPADEHRLSQLIDRIVDADLDVVTFTSSPGAEAFLQAARNAGRLDAVLRALRGPVLAAVVGPVTAAPLRENGVRPLVPDRYRLGALIRLVTEHLDTRRVLRAERGGHSIEVRGSRVLIDHRELVLPPSGLAVFRALLAAPGVLSRAQLAHSLPDAIDDHALEVQISRLRRALGAPDLIQTVVKRGYRLAP